jgi:hypothetical protein
MNDRKDQAPAAAESRTSDATPEAAVSPRSSPPTGPRPDARAATPPNPAAFSLQDFLSGSDTRLRDLLAFGMAVEAGRLSGAEGVGELRRRAEADLEAHAFRVLHNQAEAIRRQAMDDQLARLPRGVSFFGVVLATTVGIALCLLVLALIWLAAPSAFGELHAYLAQLAARFRSGS